MQRLRDLARLAGVPFFLACLVCFVVSGFLSFSLGPFAYLFLLLILPAALLSKARRRRVLVLIVAGVGFLSASLFLVQSHGTEGEGRYSGIVIDARESYFLLETGNGRYIVYEEDSSRERGDVLAVDGTAVELTIAHYESRFSFEEYLNKKGVYHEIEVEKIDEIVKMPIRLSARKDEFISAFDSETGGILSSLLFGRSGGESLVVEGFEEAGAYFYLSSSGTILGSLLYGIDYFLSLKCSRKVTKGMTFGIGVCLSLLYPFRVGMLRVILGRFYAFLFASLDIKPNAFASPILSAFTIILLDFRLCIDSGFLIGFGLSLGFRLSGFIKRAHWKKRGIYSFLLGAAFIFPVLAEGGSFHLLSPLYSLILLPLVEPLNMFGIVSFLTLPFVDFFEGYTVLLKTVSETLSKIDIVIPIVGDSSAFSLIYYTILLAFLMFVECGMTLFSRGTLLAGASLFLVNYLPVANWLTYRVTFIDVGQGDAILIVDHGDAMLVDTGGNLSFDMAEEVLVPYFRKERIYSLKALVTTHDDLDHSGAKETLPAIFPVEKVLDEASDFPFTFGSTEIVNLNQKYDGSDENDSSLILRFDMAGTSFLLTGDASSTIEKQLVRSGSDLDVDVLKLGHHGSSSSSCLEFLKATSPELAIVSCGEGNYYGHPNAEVIQRCASLGIKVRRTDLEGSIELWGSDLTGFDL